MLHASPTPAEATPLHVLTGFLGSGKTTLLRMAAGFEQPDEGRVLLDGRDITDLPPEKRPLNTVFQNYALFPHLTVGDNIGYGLDVKGVAKPERQQRVGAALALVGLDGFERRKPRQLSGGQQQRVALARAIVNRPRVLLLDEPLSALDRKLREAMQIELKNIQHELGIAFVFVTHDQQEALTMSDRIVVMEHGAIRQVGSPTEVYDRPSSVFVARFVGEGNLFDGVVRPTGGTLDVRTREGISIRVAAAGNERPDGATVQVLIRPEDLELAAPGSTPSATHGTLDAEIVQTLFVGSDFQVVARTTGDLPLKATIRDPARSLSRRLQPGLRVVFRYPLTAPRLLDPEPAA
ncbi:MAG: polyamine ABC transporter ATP-binding protein [Planctomycetes bacterium]|nr:polyamine ABC transporter ATP-binding protein [Planctomycetota bacterium]